MNAVSPLDFINRELSWLEFNRRVLHQAIDQRTPILERVRFFSIFSSNLDEFFMKRVGGLKRQVMAAISSSGIEQTAPRTQLEDIRNAVLPLLARQADLFSKDLHQSLQSQGIFLLKWDELTPEEISFADDFFRKNLFPVLTPLAVDPGHPFPFISNLSTSFGVLMKDPNQNEKDLFARVKIPDIFPSWIRVKPGQGPNSFRLISLNDIIEKHLSLLFPGMEIQEAMRFRITRNADIERDEEDVEDLLEMIAEELRVRKFADVVRIEHGPNPSHKIMAILREELDFSESDIYALPIALECFSIQSLFFIEKPGLRYPPWIPVVPPEFGNLESNIFDLIRSGDILVHHPYESFTASVERLIQAASNDPNVIAIKMTMYRIGEDSPFIPFLIRAAEAGKQVVCLVELKARFDEEQNILIAQALEKAGVHVVYGIVGLKTHCKVALVIRKEANHVQSYVHIGTGNYHSGTARAYTDLGLFTAKDEYTEDVVHLFHYLTGRSVKWHFKKLFVAPIDMKESIFRMIEREISNQGEGKPAHIIAKMNNLEDAETCRMLYKASQKGVKIDLFVRGICCLRPGVPGLSENIKIISVVGRFLEHSRLCYFRNAAVNEVDGDFLLGSADWMNRNLHSRVEAVAPIEEPDAKRKCWEILQALEQDRRTAWQMKSDGSYTLVDSVGPDESATQTRLMKWTLKATSQVNNG